MVFLNIVFLQLIAINVSINKLHENKIFKGNWQCYKGSRITMIIDNCLNKKYISKYNKLFIASNIIRLNFKIF